MPVESRALRRFGHATVALGLVLLWNCGGTARPEASTGPSIADPPSEVPERTPPEPVEPPPAEPSPPRADDRPDARSDALSEGEWVVIELAGEGLLDGSRITLDFQAGQVSGTASCNRYVAEWSRPAPDRIRIVSPRATLRACAPTVMDQERRFLDLLSRFETVRVGAGDDLELRTGAGETLRATRF